MKEVKFYARPHGKHIHASEKCPLLEGAVFMELGYEEVTLEEAQKRELSLCGCVDETFKLERYLTLNSFIRMLNEKGKA